VWCTQKMVEFDARINMPRDEIQPRRRRPATRTLCTQQHVHMCGVHVHGHQTNAGRARRRIEGIEKILVRGRSFNLERN
jgi:hypothetical protein